MLKTNLKEGHYLACEKSGSITGITKIELSPKDVTVTLVDGTKPPAYSTLAKNDTTPQDGTRRHAKCANFRDNS